MKHEQELAANYRAAARQIREIKEKRKLTEERKHVEQLKQQAERVWQQLLNTFKD